MGTGYITAACAIVRTALSGQILEKDVSYAMIPNAAWRATEVNLGIICANAPILRPLYLWYKGRLTRKGTSKGSSYVATKGSGSGGQSKVRLWPKGVVSGWAGGNGWSSKAGTKGGDGGKSRMLEESERSGYTEASAELGLPIEGYLMGEQRKSDNKWADDQTEERFGDRERLRPPPAWLKRGGLKV